MLNTNLLTKKQFIKSKQFIFRLTLYILLISKTKGSLKPNI